MQTDRRIAEEISQGLGGREIGGYFPPDPSHRGCEITSDSLKSVRYVIRYSTHACAYSKPNQADNQSVLYEVLTSLVPVQSKEKVSHHSNLSSLCKPSRVRREPDDCRDYRVEWEQRPAFSRPPPFPLVGMTGP